MEKVARQFAKDILGILILGTMAVATAGIAKVAIIIF